MAHNDHSEYQHGSMDIRDHEKTYNGFIRFTKVSVVLILVVLVFLAIART